MLQLFGNRLAVEIKQHQCSSMRDLHTLLDATTHIGMIRQRATAVCVGLQDLELPALIMLEIIDIALPNCIRMKAKWDLVVTVKHWRERRKT
jgi:hypothetical protein